jgi:hypothetical protein
LVAFDNTQNYSWPILTASGGITGFNAANVTINTSAFGNGLGSGGFTVSVSNNTMYLNFGQPPVVTVTPATFSVASGHTAYITASATGSQLTYAWTLNGGNLTSDVSGQGTATLTISPARDADAGTYTVTVSNPISSVSGSSLLIVVDPPQYSAPNTTFTMNFSGPVGQNYRVWSTSNPALPVLTGWNFMGSFQFTAGVNTFTDNNASSTAEYYCITVP